MRRLLQGIAELILPERMLWSAEWYRRRIGGRWWRYHGENPSQGPYWAPYRRAIPDGAHAVTAVWLDPPSPQSA